MEENKETKGKKISLASLIVIIINVIAIVFMAIIIGNSFIDMLIPTNDLTIGNQLIEFNSKFTTYEGIKSGSQVKQLVSIVNTNNVNNAGTDFIVELAGLGISGGLTNGFSFSGGSAKKYQVQIIKMDDVVSNITIYDINEEITEYEINNNTKEEKGEKKEKVEYKIDFEEGCFTIILYSPILLAYLITFLYFKSEKKIILEAYNEEERNVMIRKLNRNKRLIYLTIAIILCMWSFFIA
jgi:hypothetical protein